MKLTREMENDSGELTSDALKFILARVISNAFDAKKDADEDNCDFNQGRQLAYWEVLDTIKSELIVRDQDLKQFGLDFDIDKDIEGLK